MCVDHGLKAKHNQRNVYLSTSMEAKSTYSVCWRRVRYAFQSFMSNKLGPSRLSSWPVSIVGEGDDRYDERDHRRDQLHSAASRLSSAMPWSTPDILKILIKLGSANYLENVTMIAHLHTLPSNTKHLPHWTAPCICPFYQTLLTCESKSSQI